MLKIFVGIILFGSSVTSVALNNYFDSMHQADKDMLEKYCVLLKSEAAKIHPDKYASEYNTLIEKLKQKYPNLSFINQIHAGANK